MESGVKVNAIHARRQQRGTKSLKQSAAGRRRRDSLAVKDSGRVDNVVGIEVVGVGDCDSPQLDGPFRHRFVVDRSVRTASECAGDTASHPETRSGGVYERVGALSRDIALDDGELHISTISGTCQTLTRMRVENSDS